MNPKAWCSLVCQTYIIIFSCKKCRQKAPPSSGTLCQHIKCAKLVSFIRSKAFWPNRLLLSPTNYDRNVDDGKLIPVLPLDPAAPDAVMYLMRCSCKENCSTRGCSCLRGDVGCIEKCTCTDDYEEPSGLMTLYNVGLDDMLDEKGEGWTLHAVYSMWNCFFICWNCYKFDICLFWLAMVSYLSLVNIESLYKVELYHLIFVIVEILFNMENLNREE